MTSTVSRASAGVTGTGPSPRTAAAIRAAGPRIAHVHVDDTNRLQPGTGHMDFAAVFGALRAVGYDGWLTFECRLRGRPEEALPASTRFLRRFLQG